MGQAVEPGSSHRRQQVVRHVFLIVNRDARGERGMQRVGDASPVDIVMRDHLVTPRVRETGGQEVVGVEGLVHDDGVRTIAERAH